MGNTKSDQHPTMKPGSKPIRSAFIYRCHATLPFMMVISTASPLIFSAGVRRGSRLRNELPGSLFEDASRLIG